MHHSVILWSVVVGGVIIGAASASADACANRKPCTGLCTYHIPTGKCRPFGGNPYHIGLGKRGPDVLDLQVLLQKDGFKVKPDGEFGVETEKAVKAFQEKNNLSGTGIVDEGTLEVLLAK